MELRERLNKLISVRWIACGGTPTLEQFSDFADLVASLALEEARKEALHFKDALTPEEYPKHGLYPASQRFDNGFSEKISDWIAGRIAALAESLKGTK